MSLTVCPQCQRHVRRTEVRCPFCKVSFGERARLSGTAVALMLGVSTAACAGNVQPMPDSAADTAPGVDSMSDTMPTTDTPGVDSRGDGPVALYGPVPIDVGPDVLPEAGPDDAGPDIRDGGAITLYGPAPFDSGEVG